MCVRNRTKVYGRLPAVHLGACRQFVGPSPNPPTPTQTLQDTPTPFPNTPWCGFGRFWVGLGVFWKVEGGFGTPWVSIDPIDCRRSIWRPAETLSDAAQTQIQSICGPGHTSGSAVQLQCSFRAGTRLCLEPQRPPPTAKSTGKDGGLRPPTFSIGFLR
jgi:hypothetical protein